MSFTESQNGQFYCCSNEIHWELQWVCLFQLWLCKTAFKVLGAKLCICLPCYLQCIWHSWKNKHNQHKKTPKHPNQLKQKKISKPLSLFTSMITWISFISTASFLSNILSLLTSHPHRVKSGATVGVLQFHGYNQTWEVLYFIITANSKYGSEPKNWLAPWAFHVSSCHEWHDRGRRINNPPPHTQHTASLGHWTLDAQAGNSIAIIDTPASQI